VSLLRQAVMHFLQCLQLPTMQHTSSSSTALHPTQDVRVMVEAIQCLKC
jgi:hypothetical protein